MTKLAGKVELVTGGSRGVGAAVARRLAADGAAVALTYANGAAQAADVAQSIEDKGGRAVVIHADHADPPAAARAAEQTVDQLRRLDILVNNAGIFTGGPLEQAAVQDLDRILAVDVKAVFLASQAAARHMSDGGRIITIGSALADRVPGPPSPCIPGQVRAQRTHQRPGPRPRPRGIRATLVQAGPIDTDMNPRTGQAASSSAASQPSGTTAVPMTPPPWSPTALAKAAATSPAPRSPSTAASPPEPQKERRDQCDNRAGHPASTAGTGRGGSARQVRRP
jgi:3-oxoacyl-[acyl-carrier protein] reductase